MKQVEDKNVQSYNLRKTVGIERNTDYIYDHPVNLNSKKRTE